MIQLQFSASAETWIENLCNVDSALVKVMSLKRDSPVSGNDVGYVTHFVDISSEKTGAEVMTNELNNNSGVKGSDLVMVSPNRLIGAVTSNGCGVCGVLVDSNQNCFIFPAQTDGDCKMSYKLFISGEGLPILLQKMHQRGIEYKISDVSSLSSKKRMTSRQENVIKSALELGFYEFPKRISTLELAENLENQVRHTF